MGKIRVRDLAQKMGVPEQDLLFKLKSIGVRLDEENPEIDTGVIQAILEGKRLPQPREVILRDEEAKASATSAPARRRPAPRRMPASPVRPGRRRPMIQRVEPRIRTLPATEAPKVDKPPVEATPATAEVSPSQEAAPTAAPPAETTIEAKTTEVFPAVPVDHETGARNPIHFERPVTDMIPSAQVVSGERVVRERSRQG